MYYTFYAFFSNIYIIASLTFHSIVIYVLHAWKKKSNCHTIMITKYFEYTPFVVQY